MKLNIEMIFETIKNGESRLYPASNRDKSEIFSLSGVRLYRPDLTSRPTDFLYICDCTEYPSVDHYLFEGCALLLTGSIPSDLRFPDTCSRILHPSAEGALILLEKIQQLFDAYTAWMDSVNTALLERAPLQRIFDLSVRFLKNPIAMFDTAQTVILTAGDFHGESPDSVWQEALTHGYALKGNDSYYLETKFANERMPFYYTSSDCHAKVHRLVAGLHCSGTLMGTLGMTDFRAPIDTLEYYNVHMVQKIMEQALSLEQQNNRFPGDTPFYLSRLLNNCSPPADLTSYQLSLLGQTMDSPFILWVITFSGSPAGGSSLFSHYIHVKRLFPDDLVFLYENRLLVCNFHTDLTESASFREGLSTRLGYLDLLAVYSMKFYKFTHMYQAYQQCSIALLQQNLKPGCIYSAKDSLSDYMEKGIAQLSLADGLLYPGTILLTLQNPDYGTQLLKTLQTYCICGGNVSAAAKELFIHRHTMLYRLECITKIAHLDFNTLDHSDYWQLIISCALLLRRMNKTT